MVVTITPRNAAKYTRLSIADGTKIYRDLRSQVFAAGIMDRSYLYYTILIALEVAAFLAFFVLFIRTEQVLLVLASIIGISFFAVRFGGLMHDAGHRAVFRSVRANDLLGYFVATTIAFPYYVWKVNHNLHHAHANEEAHDPDVNVAISFTETMYKRETPVVRAIRRYQAYLFYPVGLLLALSVRLKAFIFYSKHMSIKGGLLFFMQAAMIFFWYIVPFIVFPFWKAGLFFVGTNALGSLYMLNIFAPNHKGMPQLAEGVKLSFLEKQIITARDVVGGWFGDYLYMGLNYQIEHHLFPACPRNKLHLIVPYVKDICAKYRIPYTEMSALASTKFILANLYSASSEYEG